MVMGSYVISKRRDYVITCVAMQVASGKLKVWWNRPAKSSTLTLFYSNQEAGPCTLDVTAPQVCFYSACARAWAVASYSWTHSFGWPPVPSHQLTKRKVLSYTVSHKTDSMILRLHKLAAYSQWNSFPYAGRGVNRGLPCANQHQA